MKSLALSGKPTLWHCFQIGLRSWTWALATLRKVPILSDKIQTLSLGIQCHRQRRAFESWIKPRDRRLGTVTALQSATFLISRSYRAGVSCVRPAPQHFDGPGNRQDQTQIARKRLLLPHPRLPHFPVIIPSALRLLEPTLPVCRNSTAARCWVLATCQAPFWELHTCNAIWSASHIQKTQYSRVRSRGKTSDSVRWKVLARDGGGGCTTPSVRLAPLSRALRNG